MANDEFCADGVATGITKFPNIMDEIRKAIASNDSDENSLMWLLLFAIVFKDSERSKIIRCADCEYYEKRCPSEDIGWCNRPGAGCGQPEDFWCASAERKDASGDI